MKKPILILAAIATLIAACSAPTTETPQSDSLASDTSVVDSAVTEVPAADTLVVE